MRPTPIHNNPRARSRITRPPVKANEPEEAEVAPTPSLAEPDVPEEPDEPDDAAVAAAAVVVDVALPDVVEPVVDVVVDGDVVVDVDVGVVVLVVVGDVVVDEVDEVDDDEPDVVVVVDPLPVPGTSVHTNPFGSLALEVKVTSVFQ
jgi:hypothetical protein